MPEPPSAYHAMPAQVFRNIAGAILVPLGVQVSFLFTSDDLISENKLTKVSKLIPKPF